MRLLIFVTLEGGCVNRRHAAGTLWPDGNDERAAANLRSALWRLRCARVDILHANRYSLYLDQNLVVDIARLSAWATRIIRGDIEGSDLEIVDLSLEALNLLPGWYDDWVVFERERLRQRLLHAIESLARRLIDYRDFAGAVDAAKTAVRIDPLRESAQRVLIETHLAEGNLVEAQRVFFTYSKLLTDELGTPPSSDFAEMVHFSAMRRAPVDG